MFVENDEKMPGCTVCNSNLSKGLVPIEYILFDKTGRLQTNKMTLKNVNLSSTLLARDVFDDIH